MVCVGGHCSGGEMKPNCTTGCPADHTEPSEDRQGDLVLTNDDDGWRFFLQPNTTTNSPKSQVACVPGGIPIRDLSTDVLHLTDENRIRHIRQNNPLIPPLDLSPGCCLQWFLVLRPTICQVGGPLAR